MENTSRARTIARPHAFDASRNRDSSSSGPVGDHTALRVVASDEVKSNDHFVERDGMRFAGTHLIVDLWEASNLDDMEVVEKALREAATVAGATLLRVDLHCFEPSGGITGVAVLAESHISIHTWPERMYAAVDVFMCGDAEPHRTVGVLRRAFSPRTLTISEQRRGVMP